jgi:transposase-like protein
VDFPIGDLMDESACYARLLRILHPGGLACPRCGAMDGLGIHRRHREPVLDHQCSGCGRVFNARTGTPPQGWPRRPSPLILIMRGFAQGVSTARLARELGCSRMKLLAFRHSQQGNALVASDRSPLPDEVAEADEMDRNAGGKRPRA